ncbi:MAG: STAS domain-containing protein [Bacillota bacterium]|nr:STAS domain-containing protein [Bacillota bacterium]
MDIKLVNKGTEGELILEGRLDSAAAQEADALIMSTAERFDTLTLNLEKLEYTASSGLRIIRNLQVAMNKKGGELLIKNANPMVMEVFEMTGFVGFLKFVKE